MSECKMPVNVRLDKRIVRALDAEAAANETTRTDVVISILSSYYDGMLPGVCKECGKLNEIDSKFCSQCGNKLIQ